MLLICRYSFSGCVSLPRAQYMQHGHLYQVNGRMWSFFVTVVEAISYITVYSIQVPLPEMSLLREGGSWTVHCFTLLPNVPLFVPAANLQQHADVELQIRWGNQKHVQDCTGDRFACGCLLRRFATAAGAGLPTLLHSHLIRGGSTTKEPQQFGTPGLPAVWRLCLRVRGSDQKVSLCQEPC